MTRHKIGPRIWFRIALLSLVLEAFSFWGAVQLPFGEGAPLGTSPYLPLLGASVAVIHLPVLVASSIFRWNDSLYLSILEFLTGYVDIAVITFVLYWVGTKVRNLYSARRG